MHQGPRSSMEVWMEGLRGAVTCLGADPILGLKRLVLPVSYWRTQEFAYVGRQLVLDEGAKVLDVGSPKDLAVWLATRCRFALESTDILDEEIEASRRYARARGVEGRGVGRVHAERQDGRALTFADQTFDAAYSVSVLEHIPGDGDREAIAELVRVVKIGGRIVVTVPYAEQYRESFLARRVYERDFSDGQPVFYQRHYDERTLRDRLLSVPGTRVVDLQIWGEGQVRVEQMLDRVGALRTALSPLEPLLAMLSLRPAAAGVVPMAAFFTLERSH